MPRDIRYMEPPDTYGIPGDDSEDAGGDPVRPEVSLAESVLKIMRAELAAGKPFNTARMYVCGLYSAFLVDSVLADVVTGATAYPKAAAALAAMSSPTTKELVIR